MRNIYFISGVGTSKKLFNFLDLSFCNPVFVEWLKPLKDESLQQYALRIKETIPDKSPVIVGVSFGGMLASEIARADSTAKIIIISSNKTSDEFPKYLHIGNYFPIYKWVPDNLLKRKRIFTQFVFGAKGVEQKKLHRVLLQENDIPLTQWSIGAILNWKSTTAPKNITHIHGTADTLLPYKLVKADYTIKGGTHMMIMDRANEIVSILKKLL